MSQKVHFFSILLMYTLLGGGVVAQSTTEKVETVNLNDLQGQMYSDSSQLTVVNFWATWCKPCIEEIPYFKALRKDFDTHSLKILMVSIDGSSHLSKVEKVTQKRNIPPQVLLLSYRPYDAEQFINTIHPNWSGAIPYTLFIKKGKILHTQEGSFTQEQLFRLTKKYL